MPSPLTTAQLSEIEHAVANGIEYDAVRHRRELLDHIRSKSMTTEQKLTDEQIAEISKRKDYVVGAGNQTFLMSAAEADGVFNKLAAITQQRDDARRGCEQLNAVLREQGHGQGEIDSWADSAEENERLRAQLAESKAEAERLKQACSKQNEEVCQILGRALGYPRYCDDQKNFPGSMDADGVCVGEHVAESLAEEAASKLTAIKSPADLDTIAAEAYRIVWPDASWANASEIVKAKWITAVSHIAARLGRQQVSDCLCDWCAPKGKSHYSVFHCKVAKAMKDAVGEDRYEQHAKGVERKHFETVAELEAKIDELRQQAGERDAELALLRQRAEGAEKLVGQLPDGGEVAPTDKTPQGYSAVVRRNPDVSWVAMKFPKGGRIVE